MENKDKIEIPFGAKDSELYECEYTIPEGYEAEIKDGKVIIIKKETKDERIRKEIIDFVKSRGGFKGDWIAWLEKQGQVKEPTISQYEEDERIRETIIKILLCFDHYEGVTGKDMIAWVKKQGEQKPAEWSEDDERILNGLISSLARIGANTRTDSTSINCTFSREIDWLKSLKDRFTWKPNKEQMNGLKEAIEFLGCTKTRREPLQSLYEQLKKLK